MDKSITAGRWAIRTQKKAILGEEEQDALVRWLGDGASANTGDSVDSRVAACGSVLVKGTPMQLPEILFGNNALELYHLPSGILLQFEARGALKQWVNLFSEGNFEVIKVQEAKEWQTRPGTPIRQQEYDWTWGTDYAGSCYWTFVADGWSRDVPHRVETLENGLPLRHLKQHAFVHHGNCFRQLCLCMEGSILPAIKNLKELNDVIDEKLEWIPCQPGGIDRTMLRDTSTPILMYDEVVLYEDFIHDHGVVRLSVKTRVMPQCWFVLLRYWLRVDNVIMKVIDTRCFHKFGGSSVYRERTEHFATFSSLGERGLSTDPSVYSDADAALAVLHLKSGPFYDHVALCRTEESKLK